MCNYLSTLLAFEALCVLAVLANADTFINDETLESVFRTPRVFNLTNRNEGAAPVVNMNGNYNYQAAQQVFFISGAPQSVTKGMKNCVTYLERDDYTIRPGIGVHKMHKRKVNWNRARKSCMDEGANLAILNSKLEETTLLTWMRSEGVERVWLGVHDQFEEGDWVILSGESLDTVGYEHWSNSPWPNQPDNYGGRQNCALLIKEEGMDDVECEHLHAYMCEINLC